MLYIRDKRHCAHGLKFLGKVWFALNFQPLQHVYVTTQKYFFHECADLLQTLSGLWSQVDYCESIGVECDYY